MLIDIYLLFLMSGNVFVISPRPSIWLTRKNNRRFSLCKYSQKYRYFQHAYTYIM